MNVGQLLFALRDAVDYLEKQGLIREDGVILLNNVNKDIALAGVIEQSLKNHGLDVPEEVDKVINALPLIIGLFLK